MHIIEKDEHLDYSRFWTGKESTADAGHAWWEITQGLADSYPCRPCKPGAQALAYGGHDAISLLLNKPGAPRTPEHFVSLKKLVDAAWEKYQQKLHTDHIAGRHSRQHMMEAEHHA